MPMVATAVPNSPSAVPSTIPDVLPSQKDSTSATDMTSTGAAVASSPTPIPAMMLVAWPVVDDSAIMRTGLYL